MAGLFSKGGGVPLTPAQVQLQQMAIEQAKNVSGTWIPVQQYFANQLRDSASGLKEMARGTAAGSARAAGDAALAQGLQIDSARGAGAGSGRFLADLGAGGNQLATAVGSGLADATGVAERHYVRGLQEILGIAQRDQNVAQRGLQQAAQAQAQEAGAVQQADQATSQSAMQTIGMVAALA